MALRASPWGPAARTDGGRAFRRRGHRSTATACLVLAASLAGWCPPSLAAAPPVAARAAALYDRAAGRFLYERHADQPLPPASTAKILTALVALEDAPAGRTTPVAVPAEAALQPETDAHLVPGEVLPLAQLLPAMMVRSANDGAVAVAHAVAGSVAAFAERMNATARQIGLMRSHFVNPSGLDAPGQYTTARDLALLADRALSRPDFRELVSLRRADLPPPPRGADGGSGTVRTFFTHNRFLLDYPGATGVKTGYTSAAGFCLVASAVRGDRELVAVILGDDSAARAEEDAAALMDWGFATPAPPRTPAQPPDHGPATVVADSRTAPPVDADGAPRGRRPEAGAAGNGPPSARTAAGVPRRGPGEALLAVPLAAAAAWIRHRRRRRPPAEGGAPGRQAELP
jgi:D-alanyl-D-alanine carboxypeptidase